MAGQMQHLRREARESQLHSGQERFDLLDRPRHPAHVLPMDSHVLEQLARRAQPIQVGGVQLEPLRRPIAPGQLVVVARVGEDGRPGLLLRRPRIPVVIDVPVRDEDAAHLPQAAAQRLESGEQRSAPFPGADARIEKSDPAAVLLDDVHVRRPPRLGKRDGHGNAMDAESSEARHCSFFTASAISGSALKRSPTRP